MARVGVYCDGFNVYYGLRRHFQSSGRCFYWLNIPTFAESLARRQPFGSNRDSLSVVKYFTADPVEVGRAARHQNYFDTIRGLGGVDIIDGRHSEKPRKCPMCNSSYPSFEEKETDVSVGVHIVCDAIDGLFDRLILVSADTDFVPALRMIRQRMLPVEIVSAIPLGRYSSERLAKLSDHQIKLKPADYMPHRMAWTVTLRDGRSMSCPAEWRTI